MKIIASGFPSHQAVRAAILMLVLAITVPGHAAKTAPEPADEKTQQAELDRIRSKIEALNQDLTHDRGQQDALEAELEAAEKNMAQLAGAAQAAAGEVESQKGKVDAARRDRARAETQLGERRARLARALRALYMADAPTRLQAVFEADRLAAIERSDVDAAAVAGVLSRQVFDVQGQIESLRKAQANLEHQLTELDSRKQAQQSALASLKTAQARRQDAIQALGRRVADKTAQRQEAQEEQARVEKLLEAVRKALRDQPQMKFESGVPFGRQRGHLPWPLRGKILANFGDAKAGGRLTWSGLWIGADEGAPVRAVADARVVYIGQVQRYGLVVILDHAGDYLSLYGQLQSASTKVGKVVQAGDTIAAAGTSGGHEQAGVYFEIRQGTTPVDPKGWLVP